VLTGKKIRTPRQTRSGTAAILGRDGVPFKMECAEAAIRVDEDKTTKKIKLLARLWVGHARVRAVPVHTPCGAHATARRRWIRRAAMHFKT
jgi:hypothetical protein